MAEKQPKKRLDLIGMEGSKTVAIKVVDALEYPTGVNVRVTDSLGETYWTSLDNVELDK